MLIFTPRTIKESPHSPNNSFTQAHALVSSCWISLPALLSHSSCPQQAAFDLSGLVSHFHNSSSCNSAFTSSVIYLSAKNLQLGFSCNVLHHWKLLNGQLQLQTGKGGPQGACDHLIIFCPGRIKLRYRQIHVQWLKLLPLFVRQRQESERFPRLLTNTGNSNLTF